jgi:cation diffusion facilitator CzcD-associated flavoprotein CzcO
VTTHGIAIIGAGPYGVSIAAHLRSAGMDFRIFGKPMCRWRCQMPAGMFLKSEGCASSLPDPSGSYSLARYCTEAGLTYGERGVPVSREVFTRYALSFQQRFAPAVEEDMVVALDKKSRDGFELHLASGSIMTARKVVVATGLENAAYIPPEIAGLPSELLTHSADHSDLGRFRGRDVTVIGGGQSALETAALLSEEGACVRLLVRSPNLVWNETPRLAHRSLYKRLRYPVSGLGEGLRLWFYCSAPTVFRRLPQQIRFETVRTALGPAGAWWLRERVLERVTVSLGCSVSKAVVAGGRALLQVAGRDGSKFDLVTDHVIAATGYRFSLARLPFLNPILNSQLHAAGGAPALSSGFESSVPGLYFTGLSSANTFGPAMRFLAGAHFTARRVCRDIAAGRRRNGYPAERFARLSRCGGF